MGGSYFTSGHTRSEPHNDLNYDRCLRGKFVCGLTRFGWAARCDNSIFHLSRSQSLGLTRKGAPIHDVCKIFGFLPSRLPSLSSLGEWYLQQNSSKLPYFICFSVTSPPHHVWTSCIEAPEEEKLHVCSNVSLDAKVMPNVVRDWLRCQGGMEWRKSSRLG